MAKDFTDTLFSFQIYLISRAKFSYFVIFSPFVLESLGVKGTSMSIINTAFFLSVDEHRIKYVEVHRFISNDRPVPI